MGTGILICGLNGAGKTTLGRALAQRLQVPFIDSEDLFFPEDNRGDAYASPRPRKEAEEILFQKIKAHRDFVFAAVKWDGKGVIPFVRCVIWVDAPKDIRLQRVRNRSYEKLGDRMLPGGDLHGQEEGFFEFVRSRPEDWVKKWVGQLNCPVFRVDGTKPIEANVDFMIRQIENHFPRTSKAPSKGIL